jgi:ADP-ribose pyrophosphatase YjhB (NUDIX family)
MVPHPGPAASLGQVRPTEAELLRWSEALAGIARTGLGFTENLYERERFEEVLHVAADMQVVAGLVPGDTQTADVVDAWLSSVGSGVGGYVTPKVAVGAVVGDDAGRILLIKRADSGVWLYPTGWADVGYSPAEVVVKEVAEETGIVVDVLGLLAVLDGMQMGLRLPMYSLVWHCRAVGGELAAHPLECSDVGWFAEDELPEPLAGARAWKDVAFAAIHGRPQPVVFDPPRQPVWRTPPEGSP